ncbi:hypothetical protein P8C59_005791 [Phyllachora maydis]|uniref:Uncharacterized protein n=1 Tax=Phyllachora maydis TaxID=1825666 RepID=A0AAD9I6U9_9PEZI|nr:hypothetical protein P8C59_005791 [Phyllachora maydis]
MVMSRGKIIAESQTPRGSYLLPLYRLPLARLFWKRFNFPILEFYFDWHRPDLCDQVFSIEGIRLQAYIDR